MYDENLALLRQTGDSFGISDALADMAWSAAFQGKAAEAVPLLREAADIAWKMGYWECDDPVPGEQRPDRQPAGRGGVKRPSSWAPPTGCASRPASPYGPSTRPATSNCWTTRGRAAAEKVFEQAWSEGQTLRIDQLYTIITADQCPAAQSRARLCNAYNDSEGVCRDSVTFSAR